MSHDDAAMYERAIREGREVEHKNTKDIFDRVNDHQVLMEQYVSGCHVPNKDESDPPIIRDLKEMAVDLQNLKGTVKTLEERMNILMLDQHNLKSLLGSLSEEVESRRPYKCPVCKGTSFCKEGMCCIPCDGTGILWG